MTDEEAIKARIRELEAENEKLREEATSLLDKRHAEIDAIEQRAERAEAKLRELAEAAVWRAECLEAADHCFMQRNTFVYSKKDIWKRSFWERWNRSYRHSTKLFKQANADYQAALKAAIGE